ncbi:hypothetical protein [Pseudalkalibacillus berkeleyi]|uniref:PepSY domain-containing protein n=1 Tax=Pseudalkalibacillus berkeleyi TaxID=1069813 RepID=A0ABS9H307_9BACL|nr:hypothetical protein [Pseudalkalibacillus berkeleyi]MCF6138299.1 hypothetical protein [Pseudalkalibacillus berkeleyi]
MKKIGFSILFVFILFISNGCENSDSKISIEEVESIVIERHPGGKIIEVNHKRGKYVVEWENIENCESGIDHIDDQSGKFIKSIHSIC